MAQSGIKSEQTASVSGEATTTPAPPPVEASYFNATLYAHRSLDQKGFRILMAVVAAFCVFAAIRFILIGAWPVVIFVVIDLIALWLAFQINYRAARAYETVQLGEKDLILTYVDAGGQVTSWRFEPYWVKIHLTQTKPEENELSFSSHGETLVFGRFLTPEERQDLKVALDDALGRWRNRQPALQ